MNLDKAALDRHITGNYGEDQFRKPVKLPKAYYLGESARKMGRPISSCKCKTKAAINAWKWGWTEMDMEMAEYE